MSRRMRVLTGLAVGLFAFLVQDGVPPRYVGPGDVVPGAIGYWGLRSYRRLGYDAAPSRVARATRQDGLSEDVFNDDGNIPWVWLSGRRVPAVSFCGSANCSYVAYNQAEPNGTRSQHGIGPVYLHR